MFSSINPSTLTLVKLNLSSLFSSYKVKKLLCSNSCFNICFSIKYITRSVYRETCQHFTVRRKVTNLFTQLDDTSVPTPQHHVPSCNITNELLPGQKLHLRLKLVPVTHIISGRPQLWVSWCMPKAGDKAIPFPSLTGTSSYRRMLYAYGFFCSNLCGMEQKRRLKKLYLSTPQL
jgi:hypothetical protein